MGFGLDAAVLEDAEGFGALEEEWEDLYRNSPRATPFQSWAWLYSWWEHYGEGYELRLVTLRDGGGLLVGLLPLVLKRRWGFGVLLFAGAGRTITTYNDVLVRRGWEGRVFEAARHALKRLGGWQVADLQWLRPEAAAWEIFRRWGGPRTRVWQDVYSLITVKPWDDLVASLSKSLRKSARRTIRRAEADGVSRRLVGPEEAEEAARRLVALHRELWRGRGIDPEHLTGRFEALTVAAARRMTDRGLGGIYELWRDGEVIVSQFLFFGSEFDEAHAVGVSKKAMQRYQWDSLNTFHATDISHGRNSARLSLGYGDPAYKLQWASERVPGYRAILGRGFVFWFPFAAYRVAIGARGWGRDARRRYRALSSEASRYVAEPANVLLGVRSATKRLFGRR
jgi:hypothetical protein